MPNNDEHIIGEDSLYESMNKCIKNTLWKDGPAHFYLNWSGEISRLSEQLRNGTYKEGRKSHFYNGKREIQGDQFRDRVYQRSLHDNELAPILTKSYIRTNCACQTGKGTKDAKDLLKKMLRRAWINFNGEVWCLKCDIKGYYKNLRHDVSLIEPKRKLNANSYNRTKEIVDKYAGDKGLVAGNPIVQILGVSALNGLDHFIKEELRFKDYIRYLDDFILLSGDERRLINARGKIEKYLSEHDLQLNERKTKIFSLKDKGVEFLGFVFNLSDSGKVYVTISPNKMKKKYIEWRRMVAKAKRGERSKEKCDRAYNAWKTSHASYGNTRKLFERTDAFYKNLWSDYYGTCA